MGPHRGGIVLPFDGIDALNSITKIGTADPLAKKRFVTGGDRPYHLRCYDSVDAAIPYKGRVHPSFQLTHRRPTKMASGILVVRLGKIRATLKDLTESIRRGRDIYACIDDTGVILFRERVRDVEVIGGVRGNPKAIYGGGG